MKITKKQRGDMLRAHNKLRDTLSYIDDCRDISLSHLRDIEEAICVLHQVGEFRPKRDENNHSMFWADWVYAEDAEKRDD
tara:strand:+ start:336 stop:575 length:240 start_codon:yes stop_codon:yes gene_type:complete